LQTPWSWPGALSNTCLRRVCARPAMDSDPVRRQGPERDNAEGEVVLGASPPARPCPLSSAPAQALKHT
jgi:hypothetical protein